MEELIREKRKILVVMLSLCVLFYFILTILLPVTYVRRFSVLSLVPDRHVIECYVPGKAIETILSDHLEKSEITYSPQGDGTLVKIETQTAELLGKIEIGIQFIPEDKTELLTKYSDSSDDVAYEILEYTGKSPIPDVYDQAAGGSWGASGAMGVSLLGLVAALVIDSWKTDRIRRKNLQYGALEDMASAYLRWHVQRFVPQERKLWMKQKLKRRILLSDILTAVYILLVSGGFLWPGILIKIWEFIAAMIVALLVTSAATGISKKALIHAVRRIGLSEETAADIWWCMYCLHAFDGRRGEVWSVSDINKAFIMTYMGYPEESYKFAEGIWKRFGWKLTEGECYFMYHLIQQTNCRLLGKAEEEKEHRWEMEKEKNRRPKKALYQKLLKTAESIK
ncbi:MAG TPA: hypothetical protein H9697_03825 [Candidatus Mediterraneibacter faecavium]|uniref:Uncharacterized protein n=1 Tax=Candidatus Mediterraneibacter faecavium TaxID=2838668 RepID=A0A9D2TL47_9FIRM|nr:hypothetical protein [Candidatus Mediterraneibacter faecavium]